VNPSGLQATALVVSCVPYDIEADDTLGFLQGRVLQLKKVAKFEVITLHEHI
jgi:hypothetical protein